MTLHLVYIGAAAELAPAASLRALAGGGAVYLPDALDGELADLLAGEVPAIAGTIGPGDLTVALDRALSEPVIVAVAGVAGPALARALLAGAAQREIAVTMTPRRDDFGDALVGEELVSLRRIIAVLRERCPWDRVQTARDIVSYTVEEVYELADAIAEDDLGEEHGELGDLLMQVYFLARLLEERDAGDVGTVARQIEEKLIRRHAHIFGDVVAETPGEVRGQWDRIKREQEGRRGIFHDVPETLPALLLARKLQERAAAVGFDWETAAEAFPKIAEEHAELEEVLLEASRAPGTLERDEGSAGREEGRERLRHEVGDLLFAVVNVARKAGVDPELALRAASLRFEERVCAAESLAQREGNEWAALELAEQESYYQRAKQTTGQSERADREDRTDQGAM